MYIVVWWGGFEAPDVAFSHSLVEAQAKFDAWATLCPKELTVTLYRVDPDTERTFILDEVSGDLPF